ncbi:MAG: Ig-like domain-containing protein [Clostridiales bacterium]|nr:Ig-like domain-containing protein [Clostridiales bacterium]
MKRPHILKKLLSLVLTAALLVGTASPLAEAYTHASEFKTGYTIYDGIDVSKWQGTINWSKVAAAGIDFVFIRCGYTSSSSFTLNTDPQFETNIKNAQKYGIQVGVYYFSQAKSTSEAKKEAAYVLKLLKGYDLDLPVAFDAENAGGRFKFSNFTKTQCTNIALAFCAAIKAGGYDACVYNSVSTFSGSGAKYNPTTILNKGYKLWVAHYANTASNSTYSVSGYTYWQYTSTGKVSGISGSVDRDYWYSPLELCMEVDDDTAITSLSLNKTSASLKPGGTLSLTATAKPSGTSDPVCWSSSNTSVAYVNSSGKVTAVQSGTATITASSSSGSVKATCKVTVSGGTDPDEVIVVTYGNSAFDLDNKTSLSPDSYQALSNSVLTVKTDGTTTIKGAGVTDVTAKVTTTVQVEESEEEATVSASAVEETEEAAEPDSSADPADEDTGDSSAAEEAEETAESESSTDPADEETAETDSSADPADEETGDSSAAAEETAAAESSADPTTGETGDSSVAAGEPEETAEPAAEEEAEEAVTAQAADEAAETAAAAATEAAMVTTTAAATGTAMVTATAAATETAVVTTTAAATEETEESVAADTADSSDEGETPVAALTTTVNVTEEKTIRVVVQRRSLNSATLKLKSTSLTYTGKKVTPTVSSLKLGSTNVSSRSYTVYANNNINRGKATVTLVGKNNYCGAVSANFYIRSSQSISLAKSSYSVALGSSAFSLRARNTSQYGGKLTYSSSNTSVVKVSSSGKVTVKGLGIAYITVTAAQNSRYSKTTKKIKVKVVPKKVTLSSLTRGRKKITVKWKTTTCSGYQIQYSTSSSFKSYKTVTVSGKSSKSKVISGLKSKKKYYVRVRAYYKSSAGTVYGSWSSKKSVKTK